MWRSEQVEMPSQGVVLAFRCLQDNDSIWQAASAKKSTMGSIQVTVCGKSLQYNILIVIYCKSIVVGHLILVRLLLEHDNCEHPFPNRVRRVYFTRRLSRYRIFASQCLAASTAASSRPCGCKFWSYRKIDFTMHPCYKLARQMTGWTARQLGPIKMKCSSSIPV